MIEPVKRIIGSVVDERRQPVGQATIHARPLSLSAVEVSAQTNDVGVFRMPPLPAGKYRMQVHADHLLPLFGKVVHVPQRAPLHLVLSQGRTVSGLVLDREKRPVVGATVGARTRDVSGQHVGELGVVPGRVPPIPRVGEAVGGGDQLRPIWSAITDSSGRYVLRGLPSVPVQLVAQHREFNSATTQWIDPGSLPPPLAMSRSSVIAGRVVDERGLAVYRAHVRVRGQAETRNVYSSRSGEFAVRGISGSLKLTVSLPGFVTADSRRAVEAAGAKAGCVVAHPSSRGVARPS